MWWSTLPFIGRHPRGRIKGCASILHLRVGLTTLLFQLKTEVDLLISSCHILYFPATAKQDFRGAAGLEMVAGSNPFSRSPQLFSLNWLSQGLFCLLS